jgi:acyl-CoA reductase-like NAD-dependent aldehyde dehydrogenase
VLISEDADLDLAVVGRRKGVFAIAGQRWRGAARVFVQRKAAREFAERVVVRVQALRLGDGMLPTADVGPVKGLAHHVCSSSDNRSSGC